MGATIVFKENMTKLSLPISTIHYQLTTIQVRIRLLKQSYLG